MRTKITIIIIYIKKKTTLHHVELKGEIMNNFFFIKGLRKK
jgi:hypothetical protein